MRRYHLPAVEVALPGAAGFDVTVPDGVSVQPRADGSPASAPWPVDIPVEVAGYRLRFTQARLEEVNGTILLVLASDPLDDQLGNRGLTALRLAAVTAPDGRRVTLETAFSGTGTRSPVDPTRRLRLGFDVVDPQTGAVRPGRYHVDIDGAIVVVKGPWRLSWDLTLVR